MKKFLNEFKEFISRGSVVDLAVGMIVGAAFTAIVTSLVNDIISPVIGLIVQDNFSNLVASVGKVEIRYGSFIMAIINFLLTAFVVFMFVKVVNKLHNIDKKITNHITGEKEEVQPTTKICPYCKSEIDIAATRCPHCTSKLEGFKEL